MSEESTTPDLVELTRQANEAYGRRDFDAAMSFFAPDAVWDASQTAFGTYEGAAAIRSFLEDWIGTFEEHEQEIVESRDLGDGVVFVVVRFHGSPAGSTGRMHEALSFTLIWEAGVCVRVVARTDIGQARVAAERRAEARAKADV